MCGCGQAPPTAAGLSTKPSGRIGRRAPGIRWFAAHRSRRYAGSGQSIRAGHPDTLGSCSSPAIASCSA